MSRKFKDYQVIYGISLYDIANNIYSFMESCEGYELCGGICVTRCETSNTEYFYQAVVKYEDEENISK